MLTETSTELRSASPSLLLRFATWMIGRRSPVFPATSEAVYAQIAQRRLPKDAPMPSGFARKYAVEEWEAAGQKVVTLHPRSGPAAWHMLYFHGGAFVLPMFREHWPLAAAMIDQCGVSITLPLYDVVPEHPHTVQDALADATFAALAAKHDPAKIILNGDSAGGHMALSLALRLAQAARDTGGPQPGKLALFAPWLDLTMADPEIVQVEPHDIMLKIGPLRAYGEMFAGERFPGSPECSPLYAPAEALALLPPTRIWTGRNDVFIVDSRSFTGKLRAAGVDAKLYEYEGAPHVFMAIVPTREAKDCFALLREFLAE